MSSDSISAVNTQKTDSSAAIRIVLGILFLLPAIGCCIGTLLIPKIQTINNSLQKMNVVSPSQFIGLDNYTRLFQDPQSSRGLGFSIVLVLGRVLAVAIVPVILALALNQFGRAARIPVRLLYSVPLA